MFVGTIVGVHAKLDDAALAPHLEKALITLRVVFERCWGDVALPFCARIPGHEYCLREGLMKAAIEMCSRISAISEAGSRLAHDVQLSFVIEVALVSTPPQAAATAREER